MTRPLDPAGDPDRYDPARDVAPSGPLDWARDPDRYDPARDETVQRIEGPPLILGRTGGRRSTLPELIGKDASFQVAFVFSHLSP